MRGYSRNILSQKNLTGLALVAALAGAAAVLASVDAKAGPRPMSYMKPMAELDSNGDGALSEGELDARKEKLFAEADANGDRVLSKEELKAYKEKKMAERHPDQDKDGVVTLAEFQAVAAKRFAKMDANNDGVLTAEEMPKRGRWGKGRKFEH